MFGEAEGAKEVPIRPAATSLALPAELVDALRSESISGEAVSRLRLPISAQVGELTGLSKVRAESG